MLTPRQINEYLWKESPLLWAVNNKIKTERDVPLEFINHRFLKDVYDDFTPIQVVRKSSQIGFSTMAILKTFNAAKFRGWNIIYTLPTGDDVNQFVSSKANALIAVNPLLARWTQDKDTIYQKKIGKSFIYYKGTFSSKSKEEKMQAGVGIMLSADLLVHDESDRSDQAILEQYESRLEASQYKGKWYFSNPTTPFAKSQQLWEKSDQKHWFVKCEHCNHWQYLNFFKNVNNGKFICEKCHEEISDEVRRNGQWVRKKESDISGYWINHLIAPWISAKDIEEAYKNKTKDYFYNFILGLPYIGSDIVINRDVILKCLDLELNFQEHNILGVDQGLKKHWVLGNRQGIFKVGVTDSWEDIEKLIRIYDVEVAVFDALPDLTEPRKLREKYPGIVWLNYYKKEVKKADFIKWDEISRTVYTDRTKIIQMLIDEMVNRKVRFQMKVEDLGSYISHWQSLYKITEQDNLGIDHDSWETGGEDHFVHATIYYRLGLDRVEGGGTGVREWGIVDKPYNGLAPDIQEEIKKQNNYE
jgi:hypothetical protein